MGCLICMLKAKTAAGQRCFQKFLITWMPMIPPHLSTMFGALHSEMEGEEEEEEEEKCNMPATSGAPP